MNLPIAWTGVVLYKMILCNLFCFFMINFASAWIMEMMLIFKLKDSCITNIQVRKHVVDWEGLPIGCALRLKVQTQWETVQPEMEDRDQMTWMTDGRGSLIKGKQDKSSQNQRRNCCFSKMRLQWPFEHKRCGCCYIKNKNP